MIDHETQLKLQAYLDGELSARDQQAMAQRLDRDPEAQAWFAELQHTKSLLAGGAPDRAVRETREFYWAGIEREIRRSEGTPAAAGNARPLSWWLKWFLPAAVAAALVCLVAPTLRLQTGEATPDLSQAQEIETPLRQASFISFRSEAEGMSVVWLDTHADD